MTLSKLLEKYNIKVPRYTSYPPASAWSCIEPLQFDQAVKNMGEKDPFEAYVHIPFCKSLCAYCGCFTLGSPKKHLSTEYIHSLIKEIQQRSTFLKSPLCGLHFGGGTPTCLPLSDLKKIIESFLSSHQTLNAPTFSIEVDPRTVTKKDLSVLSSLGFSRISLGIQDFDDEVQKAIGRNQKKERSIQTCIDCKTLPFSSIHLDLVYGLPKQTMQSFAQTISTTISLKPDRISLFSFAYVPSLKPLQKNLDPESFPSALEKANMFLEAKSQLCNAGYKSLGLDHFVLSSDPLYISYQNKRVKRTFQGYTTDCGPILGYGVSSISSIQGSYFQNSKDLSIYVKQIKSGENAIELGRIVTYDDTLRGYVIEQLLTYASFDKKSFFDLFKLPFDTYFASERKHLDPFIVDGLLIENELSLTVTEKGSFFVRTIASTFDTFSRYCHSVGTV